MNRLPTCGSALQEPTSSFAHKWGLLAALAIGLALRLAWGALVPIVPVADGHLYRAFALGLVEGRGYVFPGGDLTAYWPVGTSALYAVAFKLLGTGLDTLLVLNILLGVGIVGLTYAVGVNALGRRVACVAALIVACWPMLIQFTTVLASELPFVFLLLLALWFWQRSGWPAPVRGALWGSALCAAVYVRPTALPLFLMLPAMEFLATRSWRTTLWSLMAALTAASLLFAPWVDRNAALFGRFVLVSTNFGPNLWMGNNAATTGAPMDLPEAGLANEADRDRHYKQLATQYIADDPVRYLRLSIRRFVITHDRESIGVAWNEPGLRQVSADKMLFALKAISSAYWLAALACALVGMVLALRSRPREALAPLLVLPALFIVVPVLTVGTDRYHMPLNPFVALFAAAAVVATLDRLRPRAQPELGATR